MKVLIKKILYLLVFIEVSCFDWFFLFASTETTIGTNDEDKS